MPSKGLEPGSLDSEAFELLSRENSLDHQPDGPFNDRHSEDDVGQELHHRTRPGRSLSTERHRPEEVIGLLGGSSWGLKRRIRITGGLAIALELITQSTPSLLCAIIGSVMTGVVFDQVQFWPAFVRIGELFILVPILLNLKGCLEMNLASRLSTSVTPGLGCD